MLLALLALLLSYCGAVSVRATDRSPVAAKHPRQRLKRDHGVIIADALPEARGGYMRLLPVSPSELPKFLSLSFMMFFIVFIFTMTRSE